MVPFGDLTFEMSQELSDLMVEWVQAMSSSDTDHRDELWTRMMDLDPLNAIRGVAATLSALAESMDLDVSEVLADLGSDAYSHGDVEGALSMWEAAVDAGHGQALLYLFAAARDSDDLSARQRWEEAIRDRRDPDALWAVANDFASRGDMPGFTEWCRAAAAAGNSTANHYIAKDEIDNGRIEAGLSRLEPFARQGNPSIISTYSWTLLSIGQFDRARVFGSDVMPAAKRFVADLDEDSEDKDLWAEQLANARSNLALADLALGMDADAVVRTWQEGAATGHPESLFYPLVVNWQRGRTGEAIAAYRALEAETRSSIDETVAELATEQGWIKEWAGICRRFIDAAT